MITIDLLNQGKIYQKELSWQTDGNRTLHLSKEYVIEIYRYTKFLNILYVVDLVPTGHSIGKRTIGGGGGGGRGKNYS